MAGLDILPDSGKVRVIFHETDPQGNDGPVLGAINGKAYRYPRNREVDVPVDFLRGCIDNAITLDYQPAKDGSGLGLPTRIKRYPYTIVGAVRGDAEQPTKKAK